MEFLSSNWLIALQVLYVFILIAVALRIIYDTDAPSKTLAYLLLVVFVPVLGMFFYFSVGINYRKRKIYSKKLQIDEAFDRELHRKIVQQQPLGADQQGASRAENQSVVLLNANARMGTNPLLYNNKIDLLVNGESFYPQLLKDLAAAQKYIHMEYYIFENDSWGHRIKEVLIEKAKLGVSVRFIYDDFGSQSIRKNIVRELAAAGVRVYPFNKITWIALANRLNYRNHRKLVVIDGVLGFTGGINISDRYDNQVKKALYWRDTHLRIEGEGTYGLQHVFLCDWNFCSGERLQINDEFFPVQKLSTSQAVPLQIVASGPDSDVPSILYGLIAAVHQAKREILITTPYYVPGEALQQALIIAAMSGKKVKLLLPGITDSKTVKWASESYFEELLDAGVEIYLYQKGFVHAKTWVTDTGLAAVGTCNLDQRSFDLNFEVTAVLYSEEFAQQLRDLFDIDCQDAIRLDRRLWRKRTVLQRMKNSLIRLLSPLL